MKTLRPLALLILAGLLPLQAAAQAPSNYPNRAVRVLVGYPAGGANDIVEIGRAHV